MSQYLCLFSLILQGLHEEGNAGSWNSGLEKEQILETYSAVTPMMRLYLPRLEARLRGITAWWFCCKRGNLHTIPCIE